MTILYVEDDEEDQLIFNDAILSISIDTTLVCAISASEALAVLADVRPDYIFLDLGLPEISGIDFLKRIKASRQHADIPVVIFTSSIDPDDETRCMALGALGFVYKPYAFQQACNILEKFVCSK